MATKKDNENKQKQSQVEEKSAKETTAKSTSNNAQAEFDVNQEIEQLTQTLSGNFSEIDIEEALELIDRWHGFLNKTKEPNVKELAGELKNLQKMLKGGKASGYEISESLMQLGEQTGEFATNADKGMKQPVQRLGKQLRTAGTSLAKAEDQEYHQQIDTLVEKAEEEELTSLNPDEAVGAIDFWYNLLNKAEGEQFQQLANSLKELKQTLKRSNAKPEAIAQVLTEIGEKTAEVASEAPRGFKSTVQKLGKQLSKAGKSLTSEE